jgi:hypothetical protein
MPAFGTTSMIRLRTCDPRLQRIFTDVVFRFDCTIICGHRSVEEQQRLYAQGRTVLGKPIVTHVDGVTKLSMHNHSPSLAVDVVPWAHGKAVWGHNETERRLIYHFAGYVRRTAEGLGFGLRWGGDWQNDFDLANQTFFDLPHYELVEGTS